VLGLTDGKSPIVISQYSYTFEPIHQQTAKYKDHKIMHKDNYVFFSSNFKQQGKTVGEIKYYIWYAVLEVREIET
jgi:hypothetical protein